MAIVTYQSPASIAASGVNDTGKAVSTAIGGAGGVSQPTTVIRGAPSGSDIAPGSSMSGNYTYSGTGTSPTITPADLTPTSLIQVPKKPVGQNAMSIIEGGNAALGVTPSKNLATVSAVDTELKNSQDLFKQYLSGIEAPPSLANEYQQMERDAGIAQKQQAVNDYTAQINAVTAQAQAAQLAEVGQGRGIPTDIIGGRQAEISREAAIKVLPLQAQLAASQGALEFAKSRLDTLFTLKSQDMQAQYQYKNQLREAVYNFADKQQQIKINDLQKKDERAYQEKQNNLKRVDEWSKLAIENGQGYLVSSFHNLDTGSKTFDREFGRLMTQVKPKAKAVSTQVVEVNGRKFLINSQTGETIKEIGGGTGITTTLQNARMESGIQQVNDLLGSNAIDSTVGPSFLSRSGTTAGTFGRFAAGAGAGALAGGAAGSVIPGVGTLIGAIGGALVGGFGLASQGSKDAMTGDKQNFIAGVEQLRSSLNLDELINAKARGATFGALSDQELKVLSSSATKLGTWAIKDKDNNVIGYNASEKDFKKELDKVNNFAKIDYLLKGGNPEEIGAKVMPDGTVWSLNSDGTYTQLR